MPKKAIARRKLKLGGKVYKRGEVINNWRFIRKRTKKALKNTNKVKIEFSKKEEEKEG